jgi:hypothetical protein
MGGVPTPAARLSPEETQAYAARESGVGGGRPHRIAAIVEGRATRHNEMHRLNPCRNTPSISDMCPPVQLPRGESDER